MANASITFQIDSSDDALDVDVEHTTEYAELARQRLNVAPGASAIDVASLFEQLGISAEAKAVAVISNVDGVVVNVATEADVGADTDNIAILGAYPFFFMGLDDPAMGVGSPFSMTVELPGGDTTALVDIVAFG